jgi:hypothetical protein
MTITRRADVTLTEVDVALTTLCKMLTLILLIIAAISFGLAAAGVPSRVNLVALGLLAWVLTVLIPALT